jgi:hypothetical protein
LRPHLSCVAAAFGDGEEDQRKLYVACAHAATLHHRRRPPRLTATNPVY